MRYREPIGTYPKINYNYQSNISVDGRIKRLENDLKSDLKPNSKFETPEDLKQFIHHFEYRYKLRLARKVWGVYMGVFWLV